MRASQRRDSLKLAAPQRETPENYVLRLEKQEELQRALRQLPPVYRTVLVLHDMEALENTQIAAMLELREGKVRVRLHRARLYIRRELKKVEAQTRRTETPTVLSKQCRRLTARLSESLDHRLSGELCGKWKNT